MRMAAHQGKGLQELGDSMTSTELTDWIAFDQLYGYPDLMTAAWAIVAAWAGGKAANELLPLLDADRPAQGTHQHAAAFMAMAARAPRGDGVGGA